MKECCGPRGSTIGPGPLEYLVLRQGAESPPTHTCTQKNWAKDQVKVGKIEPKLGERQKNWELKGKFLKILSPCPCWQVGLAMLLGGAFPFQVGITNMGAKASLFNYDRTLGKYKSLGITRPKYTAIRVSLNVCFFVDNCKNLC